jgi:hypothetical protein
MPDESLVEVRQFLRDHIESHEHLETLLLLCPDGRARTVEDVARELKVPAASADAALRHLVEQRLLVAAAGEPPTYCYSPGTPALGGAVDALVAARGEHHLAIMEIMGAHAIERVRSNALRTFAEAFRLKGPGHG